MLSHLTQSQWCHLGLRLVICHWIWFEPLHLFLTSFTGHTFEVLGMLMPIGHVTGFDITVTQNGYHVLTRVRPFMAASMALEQAAR